MLDTNMSEDELKKEIGKCIALSCPGPHCFLLVLDIGRFTVEDEKCILKFFEYFGDDAVSYFIVVFTKKDKLDSKGMPFETYIQTAPKNLKEILNKCKNRYIAFDNSNQKSNCNNQVRNLITMIITNATKFYTNENYEKAEQEIKKREKKIEEERNTQKEALKLGVKNEYESFITQLQQALNQSQAKIDETVKMITNQEKIHKEEIQQMTNEISKAKQNEINAQNTVSEIREKLDKKENNKKENQIIELKQALKDEQESKLNILNELCNLEKERDNDLRRRLEKLEKEADDLPNARTKARNEVEFGIGDWFQSIFSAIVKILVGVTSVVFTFI